MGLLAAEVRSDLGSFEWPRLINQLQVADGLVLTPVRALDILAWRLGGRESLSVSDVSR